MTLLGSYAEEQFTSLFPKTEISLFGPPKYFNPWWDCTVNGIKTNTIGFGLPLRNIAYVPNQTGQFLFTSMIDPLFSTSFQSYIDYKWIGGLSK